MAGLKKAIQTVVQNQTARLERILPNGRLWSAEAWSKLSVKNPVMHRFALGLVWGVYGVPAQGASRPLSASETSRRSPFS
ncbi:MAG: DUF4132 domain-containing protein [Spirochaetales bacterium]|nr:DUF4132 domain-containing protein [Spirochaetales bacterium]